MSPILLPLLLAVFAPARPAPAPDKDAAVGFLSRFGYIDVGTGEAQELLAGDKLSEERLAAALREVQRFGHIPQTGLLDQATLQLMSSKRCGLPDVMKGATEVLEDEGEEPLEDGDEDHFNETPFQTSSHHFHHNHSDRFHHHHHHHHHRGHEGEPSRVSGKVRKKRFILASRGWERRNLKYHLDNLPSGLSEGAVLDAMESALRDWSSYSGLRFSMTNDPARADISFGFYSRQHGDMYAFDGKGSVLAHAFFPGSGGKLEGDIHFDAEEDWKINPAPNDNGVDLYMVALHELGHSLGLSHSPETDSIMYPYYRRNQRGLGNDDIRAMYQLYIRRRFQDDDDNSPLPTKPPRRQPARRPTAPPRPPTRRPLDGEGSWGGPKPQPGCRGHYDVVALIRNELFIFKEKLMWRLRGPGQVQSGYPVDFHRFFYELPADLKRIDAIYQREHDSKIIIFSGTKYWVYDGSHLGRARSITDFGLPGHLTKVDAATSRNGTAILFTDYKYWMFEDQQGRLSPQSPRPIKDWGLDRPIDAALTYTDGETYFFNGDSFWVYDERARSLRQHRSRASASDYWLNC